MAMDDLINHFLSALRNEGLDLNKETHPNKTFEKHVRECASLAVKLLGRLYCSDPERAELKRFAIALCALHDIGKLNLLWRLTSKPPPHAPLSAQYVLSKGKAFWPSTRYDELLVYLIYMHHSSLKAPALLLSRQLPTELQRYFKEVDRIVRRLSLKERIKLADAFGIFKLADIISAASIPQEIVLKQYEWPDHLDRNIEKGIVKRAIARTGKVDNRKLRIQKEIATSNKRHLLFVAPTGWGKTAVALLRVGFLRPHKIFYVLPTITAIKSLYESLYGVLPSEFIGEYFYFADVELFRRVNEQTENYILDIYRYFIPKFLITTIDQLFFTMLQVGRYHVKRFNLHKSLLIFDEFHLLTPQMIGALLLFLKSIAGFYDVSCLFMSATPSPLYQRKFLDVFTDMEHYVLKNEYKGLKRHRIKLTHQKVMDFLAEALDLLEKERTLIIVNTVKSAQKVYQALKEYLGAKRHMVLIHSQFAYKDRSEHENMINNADILVATQVAEVSLDVSFNRLITECAPIPSLIQRFGRVNRYGSSSPITNIYICDPETYKPYGWLEMCCAKEKLEELSEKVEREGEVVYLDDKFWDFELLYEKSIDNAEEFFRKTLETLEYFYSILARQERVSNELGREESWLAVPELYAQSIYALKKKLSRIKDYYQRRRIYAEIKKHFVSIPRSRLKICKWDENLGLPIISNYNRELGVIYHR